MQRGVQSNLDSARITKETSLQIRKLIDESRKEENLRNWCMPVIVITTWGQVAPYLAPLSPEQKASSTSIEILCEQVPRSTFDVMNLEHIMNEYAPFRRGEI